MAYVSLYRKYRSQTFDDLVGQSHVVKALTNAISSGKIAQTYLFTGPRGTGKTSTARLLAKALCCEDGPRIDFDEDSPTCQDITAGTCIDVVEMDAASDSGVDDVRERIVETAEYRPMVCRYKIFIIDEVHDLSAKAFDALLKTVEEPPPHLIFILATTEYSKVPPTIRSRCQKYEFHRASMKDLQDRIQFVADGEGVAVDPAAIAAIARMADGGYRDALTLLEQAILTGDGKSVSLQAVYDQLGLVPEATVDALLEAMKASDVAALVAGLEEIARMGRDPRAILESMLHRLADLTRSSYQIEEGPGDASRQASGHELAGRLGRDLILRLRGGLAEAHRVIRDISLPRLWLESELIRLSRPVTAAVAPAPVTEAPGRPRPRAEAPVAVAAAVAEPVVAAPVEVAVVETKGAGWEGAMADIEGVSRALHLKLAGSTALEEGNDLLVQVSRQSTADWFGEKPKAMAEIRRAVNSAYGREMNVRLGVTAGRDPASVTEVSAVELPAEGSRLEQLTREVFETGA